MTSTELEELRTLLRTHNGDLEQLKKVMSKIMANVYVGKDMSQLFPDIVLQARVKESSITRLIGMYTAQYAHLHADTALLCVNLLTKEILHDAEPTKRGQALQTLGSLHLPSLAEYVAPPIKVALQDPSPYVRRLAVCGCVKVYLMSCEVYEEQLLALHLEEVLEDFDEGVVALAITALKQTKPGFRLKQHQALKLLKRLQDFSDWQVPLLLAAMDPASLSKSRTEVLQVLHLVDSFLDDCSPSVVLSTVKLLHPIVLSLNSPDMNKQFVERVKAPLLFRVRHSPPEIAYMFCSELPGVLGGVGVLEEEYKAFYPSHHDPAYLKEEKLRLLSRLVTRSNVRRVVTELLLCLESPLHRDVASQLVECVAGCVLQHGARMGGLVVQLTGLLVGGSGSTLSTLLPSLENIASSLEDSVQVILPQLQYCCEFRLSPPANVALLSMLGSHGEILPECVSMLYCYVQEYWGLGVQEHAALLAACLKQSRLAGMDTVLLSLLANIREDQDPFMRGRAQVSCSFLLNNLHTVLVAGGRQTVRATPRQPPSFLEYPVPKPLSPEGGSSTSTPLKEGGSSTSTPLKEGGSSTSTPLKEGGSSTYTPLKEDVVDLLDVEPVTAVQPQQTAAIDALGGIFGMIKSSNMPPSDPTANTTNEGNELLDIFAPMPAPKVSQSPNENQSVASFVRTLSIMTIQPDMFEDNWGKNWRAELYKVQLSKTNISVSTRLQETLLCHSISTMASTPRTADPQQLFLYSHSAGMLVLIKILISFSENTFEIEVRSINHMISQLMVKSIRHIFGSL